MKGRFRVRGTIAMDPRMYFMCFILQWAILGDSVLSAFLSTENGVAFRQLWRINPSSIAEIEVLRKYENQVDFWTPIRLKRNVDMMVLSSSVNAFGSELTARNISWSILKHDLTAEIVLEKLTLNLQGRLGLKPHFDYSVYHTYDEIQQWVQTMADDYHFVTRFELGRSYENRVIGGVKGIGWIDPNHDLEKEIHADAVPIATNPRPAIWFEGGIHAREWVSPAAIMYFTNELCRNFLAGDEQVRRILGMFDFYIIPCLNVDGYAYTWINAYTRLWRKTRKPNFPSQTGESNGCVGTDLNRNFDFMWGRNGASRWPCSLTYRGNNPFDNPETKAVDDFIKGILNGHEKQRFKAFIDWHSYSQLILAPWSYDENAPLPPDSRKQVAAANAMAQAIYQKTGKSYTAGVASRLLWIVGATAFNIRINTYFTTGQNSTTTAESRSIREVTDESSGNSKDYGYGSTPNATYSYVVELRDEGEYGFLLPESEIVGAGTDGYAGVLALCDYIIDNDYILN